MVPRPQDSTSGRFMNRPYGIGVSFVGADIIRPAVGRTVIIGRILSAPTANCFSRCSFSVGRGILDAPPTWRDHPPRRRELQRTVQRLRSYQRQRRKWDHGSP